MRARLERPSHVDGEPVSGWRNLLLRREVRASPQAVTPRPKRNLPVVLALVGLLTSGCGLSFHNLAIGRGPDGGSYRVTAVFSDAANLPIGGAVKIGQATVGRVNSVSAKNFQAVVGMELREDIRVPVGTAARLEPTSALGEEYVLLQPPANPRSATLRDGDTIPRSDTTRGPDVEDTLAALGAMVGGSGLDQARTVVSELNTVFAGREQKIRDLLHRLEDMLTTVEQHSGDFETAIDSLHRLAADANANKRVLESAMTEIRPSLEVLLSQQDQFTNLLINVTELGDATNGLIRETAPELRDQMDQLRPILDSLVGFEERLGRTLTGLEDFGERIRSSIPGDYLNMDADLDLTGTVHGVLPGLLPGAPPPPIPPTAPGGAGESLPGGPR